MAGKSCSCKMFFKSKSKRTPLVPLSVYKTARQRHKRTSEKGKAATSERETHEWTYFEQSETKFGGRERSGNVGGSMEPSFLVRCTPTTKFYRKERLERAGAGAKEGAGAKKETLPLMANSARRRLTLSSASASKIFYNRYVCLLCSK